MPGEKGSYRSVYSAIWDDPEFQSFDPMTIAVFFCLRTSRDCNFTCIFPHYRSTLYERIPTADAIAIDRGMDALIEAGWIRYERPVLWIVKGLKNDPAYVKNNSKQALGIINILKSLPKLKIIEEFAAYYEIPFKFDTPSHAGINTGMDEGIGGASKHGTGTGTGTGKGKGKDQRLTPAKPVDNSTGTSGGDRAPTGPSPPVPPSGEIDPEVKNLEEIIKRRRQEMGIE